jgi:FkbM family methyltransferase
MAFAKERGLQGLKRLARYAQTFAPGLQEYRFAVQRSWLRLMRKPADPDFAVLSRMALPRDGLLLDIGANRGLTLQTLHMLQPPRSIHAFEPNPHLARNLQRMWQHDARVTVHATALGRTRGVLPLFIPTYRGYPFDGLASLDESKAVGWLNAERMAAFNPALLECHRYDVPVVPLDDFGLAPCFIKIDVQGTEFDILQGAIETLRRHAPVLLIESPDAAAEGAFLADLGYVPYIHRHGRLHANRVDSKNVFYVSATAREIVQSLVAH